VQWIAVEKIDDWDELPKDKGKQDGTPPKEIPITRLMIYKEQAFALVGDIDQKDLVFVVSVMALNVKLWNGDKKLIKGLKSKGNDIVVQTKDIC